MNGRRWAAGSALLVLVFCAAGERTALAACPDGEGRAGRIAAIVDGDTVTLDSGLTVRLAGVEAVKRLPGEKEPVAASAAVGLLERLASGASVTVYGGDRRDRYGRGVAVLQLGDGRLVQTVLLEEGLARVHGTSAEACAAAFLASEKIARKAGKGLWILHQFAVRQAGDPSLQTQKGLYHLVQGRVASVGRGSRVVFLNFGPDWRRDFTVMIARDLAARVVEGGEPALEGLRGRHVLVRGVVEDNGGPLIRINDRNAIEVLGDD
jgi:endonuclease YncB( thermonuclease family)